MNCSRRLLLFAISLSALLFAGQCFAESVVTTIPTPVPVGVDVNPLTRLVYVANFFAPTVSVISEKTNTIVDTISFPPAADGGQAELGAVAVNPVTSRLYASDPRARVVYVVDIRTKQILATVPVCNAGDLSVNPRTNKIYVSEFFCNDVLILDGSTSAISKTIPVPFPLRAAVDFFANRIYIPDQNFNGQVFVLDGASDAILAQIPTGNFTTSVGVDFRRHLAYASNNGFSLATSSLSIIDTNTNTVIGTMATDQGPSPVAVNPFTNRIYVATAFQSQNVVDIIDGDTRQIIERLPIDPNPSDAAIDVAHKLLYVTSPNFSATTPGGNVVTVIDTKHKHKE